LRERGREGWQSKKEGKREEEEGFNVQGLGFGF
jgi:hypothetical protein